MNLGIRNACFKIEITDFKFMFLSDAVEKQQVPVPAYQTELVFPAKHDERAQIKLCTKQKIWALSIKNIT